MATAVSNRQYIGSVDASTSEPQSRASTGSNVGIGNVAISNTAGGGKLMRMISKKQFPEASSLLATMVKREDISKSLPATVITSAVNSGAPVSFIKELIAAVPESMSKRDRKNKLALHAAVRCHPEAALLLIEKHPEGLLAKSQKGMLPIHYACRHKAPVDVIDCIAKYVPESLGMLTKLGWTPLHMAISSRAPDDTIIRLCTSTALRVKTLEETRLPIHVAAVAGCSIKVAKRLLDLFPEGAQSRDAFGKTALDYVIDYKRWELSKLFFVIDAERPVKKRMRTLTVSSGNDTEYPKRPRQRISSVSF